MIQIGWQAEGGDPPEKAAKLVLDIIESDVSGSFLWIEEPAFYPELFPDWGSAKPVGQAGPLAKL